MKTKLSLSNLFGLRKTFGSNVSTIFILMIFFALCPEPCALSQIPQGFNYQAIVRDGVTKQPIISQSIKVRITIETSLAAEVYQEEHALSTDEFGIMAIVIGEGTPTGTDLFEDIDWNEEPLFIKTELQYPVGGSYTEMGTAPLMSVPYAMVADSLSRPLTKLTVTGETADMEEALFEVKNKEGHTVFAVYNEGVRAYVSDGDAKGVKGGFAIGGFGTTKQGDQKYFFVSGDSIRAYIDSTSTKAVKGGFAIGGFENTKAPGQEYLRVTRDSVRIYLDANPETKSVKGGFAIGGFEKSKGNESFFNVAIDTSGKIDPSENRILWYPLKNAFRTGKVLIEKKDSVGENSFASGFESKAIGKYSQALGYQAIARNNYSTAIGYQAIAHKINSFAFGQWAAAKNEESYAFGRGAIAEGFRSYAFGSAGVDTAGVSTDVTYAIGDYSFAIGQGSQSKGIGAFAIGIADTAVGDFSVALGYKSNAKSFGSVAIGFMASASGWFSTAVGELTMASGDGSIAMGYETTASGTNSTAMGDGTIASGYKSTALGFFTEANGHISTAMGYFTTASGSYSTAMGMYSKAIGEGSTAMGRAAKASGKYSTAIGLSTTASEEYSVAMGETTTANGKSSTSMGRLTTASGDISIAMGEGTMSSGYISTAMGSATMANGNISTAMGESTIAPSCYEISIGVFNTTYEPSSATEWIASDRLFVIGNGTDDASRSNALTVLKNGHIGLQSVETPTYALELPDNSDIGIGSARAYAWATYSDGRAKSDQSNLLYGLAEVMRMVPKTYFHHITNSGNEEIEIEDSGTYDIGLIAQEVYEIIPEAVYKPENEEKDLWSISYEKLTPVLINAIQEQQAQIESQNKENQQLKSELETLKERMAAVEAMLGKD